MGYYIDQLAEQDRQKRLADLLAMQQDNNEQGVQYDTPQQPIPQQGSLSDLMNSGASRDQINAMLSQSTMTSPGFDPAGITGRGEPYMPPEPGYGPAGMVEQAPLNSIRNNTTGVVTDLSKFSRPQHDVYRDGPQVMRKMQNPDGTYDQIVKKATTDGFGRQSTILVRETVTPDYLNPVKLKQLEYQKREAEVRNLNEKPKETGTWSTVESNGKQYLINNKTGAIKPAEVGGQQLMGKKSDAASKKESQMEGLGDAISQAKAVLEGSAPDQKALPTGSGVGSMWDALAGQVGATPSGATEAQRMKVLGGALTSKMPRMEGPQSDKDTQLYREMAGLVGDDTVPIPRRLDALDQVSKLWLKYEKPKSAATAYDAAKESRYQEWKKARGM